MMTSDTNLHMHGFHVSPSGNSDNIFIRVMAGESFQYEYQIPSNHPSGLYHYHPHLHGASHQQVFGGLVGAIIIEGDIDHLPGIEGVPERMLVLQATQLTPDGSSVIAQEDGLAEELPAPGQWPAQSHDHDQAGRDSALACPEPLPVIDVPPASGRPPTPSDRQGRQYPGRDLDPR